MYKIYLSELLKTEVSAVAASFFLGGHKNEKMR